MPLGHLLVGALSSAVTLLLARTGKRMMKRERDRRRRGGNADGEAEDNVELLKVGLLTFALVRLRSDDIDQQKYRYAEFDGTTLPAPSGFSFSNACLSYMAGGSLVTDQKSRAIDRYLHRSFDEREKVVEFFERFVKDYGGRFLQ